MAHQTSVEEQNPIKQGLKREDANLFISGKGVEEQNPIKQGLKLEGCVDSSCCI